MLPTWVIVIAAILVVARVLKFIFVEKFNPKAQVDGVSLAHQNVIITGANTGIGLATAEGIAKLGAHVFLACRSKEKAEAAIEHIRKSVPQAKLTFLPLDLSSVTSIVSAVKTFKAQQIPLHILINNAGIASTPSLNKEYGYDNMFVSNCLGPFVFTELLLDELIKTRGRVVMLSSEAHTFVNEKDVENIGEFKYDDMKNFQSTTAAMKMYGFTKLCNAWQTITWHRLHTGATGVTFNAVHPGAVNTELARNVPPVLREIIQFVMYLTFLTAEQGAQTSIHVAASPSVANVSGMYFDACKVSPTTKLAQSIEFQQRLYTILKPIADKAKEQLSQ